MAQLGKYKVPRELQDEDKWFKFFTIPQLATALVVLLIDWRIVSFLARFHMEIVGIALAILLTILCGTVILFKMPNNKHLYGGGVPLQTLAFRIIRRKLFSKEKTVYTSCINDKEAE